MTEENNEIIALLKSINKKLENLIGKQDKVESVFQKLLEALQPSREYKEKPPLKELPKSTKKIPPGTHKISSKPCNKCGGLISWDGYDKSNPTPPLHVDENGYLIGNGRCPEYEWEEDD